MGVIFLELELRIAGSLSSEVLQTVKIGGWGGNKYIHYHIERRIIPPSPASFQVNWLS